MIDQNENDNKKRFSSGLFWGLLLGLLIGIFAITALTEYFFKIKSFFRTPKAEKKHELVLQEIINENNKPLQGSGDTMQEPLITIDSVTYQFYWNYYIRRSGYNELDSLTLDSLIKSRISDSIAQNRKHEEKIIRESSLNSVLKLPVAIQADDNNPGYDSIHNIREVQMLLHVELWDSPDQNKYYIWKKETLKLYGAFSHENIQPLYYKHQWYLSLNNQFYFTPQEKYMKPLRQINSAETTHDLNEIIRFFRNSLKNKANGGAIHEKN